MTWCACCNWYVRESEMSLMIYKLHVAGDKRGRLYPICNRCWDNSPSFQKYSTYLEEVRDNTEQTVP